MIILFTAGNNVVSKAIRELTRYPASHVAVQFGNYVFHSNMTGPKFELLDEFLKHSHIVRSYVGPPTNQMDLLDMVDFYARRQHRKYDFLLFLWLTAHCLWAYSLKKPVKPSDMKQVTGAYLCTEFVSTFLNTDKTSIYLPEQLERHLIQEGFHRWEHMT
jgi:hypothetical protein